MKILIQNKGVEWWESESKKDDVGLTENFLELLNTRPRFDQKGVLN